MKTFSRILIAFALMLSAGLISQAQSVVSGNPDFKIKVTRCEASGKTVVVDMIWENTGSNDEYIKVSAYDSSVYDDEGNKFTNDQLKFFLANKQLYGSDQEMLPSEIPLKARLQIEGVPVSASMLKRIDLYVICSKWGLGYDKKVKLTNIPITHEGD